MNEKPEIEVGKLPVITKFIYTLGVLPTSYLMSMTYQEQVTWLCNYLQTQVIPLLNTESAAIQELQTLYELLRTYVNDYFTNLDIQEEINNKLDEMIESGELEEIINNTLYLQLNKKSYYNAQKGVFQNEQEEKYTTYGDYIDFGEPNEPPLLDEIPYKGVDIIAHFYNDFGLKSTAMSPNQALGSWEWYDWSWNFSDTTNYDPSRVPLLGYYQGDDRKTLDWILYWLGKSGVNVLSLVNTTGINMTNWAEESDQNHWEYVLMNECKNIKNFKVLPWLYSSYSGTTSDYEASVAQYLRFIETFKDNVHTFKYNGKNYVTMFVWEFEGIRGTYDNYNGDTNTLAFFKDIASQIKTDTDFDGLCLIGRNYSRTWAYKYADSDGLIAFRGDYSAGFTGMTTYEAYADADFDIENGTYKEYQVLNVSTSHYSHPFHTSTFNCPGSTPELFGKKLNKAIQTIVKYNLPRMITIYNVSEWAEGGPGLIPNKESGFGYLDAVAGCQYASIDNIDTSKIIEDSKSYVLSKSKELVVIKKQIITINNGTTTIEFGDLLGWFNYTYNKTNYVFLLSFDTGSTNLSTVSAVAKPDFPSSRMYALIYNSGGALTELTDVYLNLMIIKKNA